MGSLTSNEAGVAVGSPERALSKGRAKSRIPLAGAYVALVAFMAVYCARPQDWISFLYYAPLAKIAGAAALLGLVFSLRHVRNPVPREILFLLFLIIQLFAASLVSPVWRGGALQVTIEFAKVLMVVILISTAVSTFRRLRIIVFTHALSLAAIAAVTVWKGQMVLGRLRGFLGGNYFDPNDMALAIVIALPLCLALLFVSKRWFGSLFWSVSMLIMIYAVLKTGSRGGFLSLAVVTFACLWEFAVKGRRRYLLVVALVVGIVLWQSSGGMLIGRLKGTLDSKDDTAAAYDSGQTRQRLFWRSIEVTKEHPLFGVGPGNFDAVSGQWHTTHNSLTLMSSEGGIPALILYVLILWWGFQNLRATKRAARGQRTAMIFARALFASLAGYTVGSLFLSVAYQFFPYMLVAYTTALLAITRQHAKQSRTSPLIQQPVVSKSLSVDTPVPNMSWRTS